MGFLDSVRRNMPGSPRNVAKHLLRYYLADTTKYPGATEKQVFMKMLKDRYVTVRTMTDADIEYVVSKTDTSVELTMAVIARENPAAMSDIYRDETVQDIFKFFIENAPMEFEKFRQKAEGDYNVTQ